MLEGMISLASYGAYGVSAGGAFGNALFYLEQNGVFAYLLPFLMIFAIVYGILSKIKMFESNAINSILSLSVGLMALQLNFVSYFFEQIFPRMGIMLAIIFVLMILMGMFWDFRKKGVKFAFGFLIFLGFAMIVYQSFGESFLFYGYGSGWAISYWLREYAGALITGVLLIGGILAIVFGTTSKENKKKQGSFAAVMEAMASDDKTRE